MKPLFLVLSLLAVGLSPSARAAGPSSSLEITSDRMDMDDRNKVAVFTGHVHANDREMKLTSERMTVYYQGEVSGNQSGIKKVTAEGDVSLWVGDRLGKGETAIYKVDENILELLGGKKNATVTRNDDRLEGKRILFYLNKDRRVERVSAQGSGGRVSARISQAEDSPGPR